MRKILTTLTLLPYLALPPAGAAGVAAGLPAAAGWGLAALLAVTVAGAAQAQGVQRLLPANGKHGRTGEPQPYPQVKINRKLFTLAPGALIFDTSNRTILQQSLPAWAHVWVLFDSSGQIARIYILRPDEVAALR